MAVYIENYIDKSTLETSQIYEMKAGLSSKHHSKLFTHLNDKHCLAEGRVI